MTRRIGLTCRRYNRSSNGQASHAPCHITAHEVGIHTPADDSVPSDHNKNGSSPQVEPNSRKQYSPSESLSGSYFRSSVPLGAPNPRQGQISSGYTLIHQGFAMFLRARTNPIESVNFPQKGDCVATLHVIIRIVNFIYSGMLSLGEGRGCAPLPLPSVWGKSFVLLISHQPQRHDD
jgi:hypothetical protein